MLYPLPENKQPVAADALNSLGVNVVSAPFGVEYVKGFIFEHKPTDYDSWGGQRFRAVDPQFVKLLLESAADSAGDAVFRLFHPPEVECARTGAPRMKIPPAFRVRRSVSQRKRNRIEEQRFSAVILRAR